jgi:hypothetical protein
MPDSQEVEILKGAKLRVTTAAVRVGKETTAIDLISEIALVEADHRIKILPICLFVLGPVVGFTLLLQFGWLARAGLVMLLIIAVGAILQRDAWMHQVTARLADGSRTALYRTSRLGDARLFHAAVQKAMEMRSAEPA